MLLGLYGSKCIYILSIVTVGNCFHIALRYKNKGIDYFLHKWLLFILKYAIITIS
jgi:uncharacterized membrane protein